MLPIIIASARSVVIADIGEKRKIMCAVIYTLSYPHGLEKTVRNKSMSKLIDRILDTGLLSKRLPAIILVAYIIVMIISIAIRHLT